MFFDGVPPPKAEVATELESPPAASSRTRVVGAGEHGPYAAKLCDACHERGGRNALVAPRDQLCFRCHEFKTTKKYVHGPLASGACLVCHDPHSSRFRHLLVSEADGFCLSCHDRGTVEKIAGHEGVGEQCTECHDAHMSDERYLLK
jgi:predicted CXXCH cytochrome family protein